MHATKPADDRRALAEVKRRLETADGGLAMRESFRRHYENLARLADDLRKLGMDEHEIDVNVMEIFREYERELGRSIEKARQDAKDAAGD